MKLDISVLISVWVLIGLCVTSCSASSLLTDRGYPGEGLEQTEEENVVNGAAFVDGSLEWADRDLQLSDDCVVDGPYYYTIDINVSPPEGTTYGKCIRPDQIKLGHDLNLLIIQLGLGERSDGDNILAMGGVCPNPETGATQQRRMLRGEALENEDLLDIDGTYRFDQRMLVRGMFVYRGGFSCGWFCKHDDRDARRKLMEHNCNDRSNWRTCYIDQVKRTLTAAVRSEIAPKYPACFGVSPEVSVTMEAKVYSEVAELSCGNGKATSGIMEFLESFTLSDFYITTKNRVACRTCSTLDFSQAGDGSDISELYIDEDTWKSSHGVTVTARAAYGDGYTPGNQPMVFDSNKNTTTFKDFRSPNEDCPGGGPGRGNGGMPGGNGENCDKLGNVLIVNRYDNDEPEPNPKGGIITFRFDNPVLFSDIGILDADTTDHRLVFHFSDGTSSVFTYEGFGDNGVQRVICNQHHVVQVDTTFHNTSGVTEINFCEHCTNINDLARSRSKLIAMEDFEDSSPLNNWQNGRLEDGGVHFTKFLGRFAKDEVAPFKTYLVPSEAASLTITMDLYQIDKWEDDDKVDMYVGNQLVELGHLYALSNQAAQTFTGSAAHGITFSLKKLKSGELGFLSTFKKDVIWRLEITVPGGGNSVYNSGQLQLKFVPKLSAWKLNESFGADNIKIVANEGCVTSEVVIVEDFENDYPLTGWSQGRLETSEQTEWTKFLGRYSNENLKPSKTFDVPSNSEELTISYDFYKIDSWDASRDTFTMWVGDDQIDFGFVDVRSEGQQIGGSTTKGVSWQATMTAGGHLGFGTRFPVFSDQKIRFDLQVPLSSGLYLNGKLKLQFYAKLNSAVHDESFGIDNIRISGSSVCKGDSFEFIENSNTQTWSWHESNARSRGCTLASITSPEENQAAYDVCYKMLTASPACTAVPTFNGQCTSTKKCKSIYDNAIDCDNTGGGYCVCDFDGENDRCGCPPEPVTSVPDPSAMCWIGGRHRINFNSEDVHDDVKLAQMKDPTGTLWKWSDDRPFQYSNWKKWQPNSAYWTGGVKFLQVQPNIAMTVDGDWLDKNATSTHKAVYRCPA